MRYRRLGGSGCRVSAVGLGTWLNFGRHLDDRAAKRITDRAFEAGVNLVDTADVYELGRAEEQLGRILAGVRREDYVLASKVFFPSGPGPNDRGLSRKHVVETAHASLRRLATDYLDLFQCHRYDPETPVEETVRVFDDLIRQGKVLYWGVSLWSAAQIEEAVRVAEELGAPPPVSNQPPYSLLHREIEAEVIPKCRQHGLGILPYSPLAQGVLTGKYLGGARPEGSRAADPRRNKFIQRYLEPDRLAKVARMKELADAAGLAMADLALAWVLAHEAVSSVLVGVTTPEQIGANARAADIDLDPGLKSELDELFA